MTKEEKEQLVTHVLNAGRGGNAHGMAHARKFVDKLEKIIDRKIEQALKKSIPDEADIKKYLEDLEKSPFHRSTTKLLRLS